MSNKEPIAFSLASGSASSFFLAQPCQPIPSLHIVLISLNTDIKGNILESILTKITISGYMQFFLIISQTLKNNSLNSIILISRDIIFF